MNCIICGDKMVEMYNHEIREGHASVYYCLNCGLAHLPSDKDLKEYYAQEYRKEYGPDLSKPVNYEQIYNTYVKYQGQRVRALEPYLGPNKTLLDVGCSTGHFIQHMHGKVKEAVGVDWDISAIAYAEMRTGWRTYSDLKYIGQKFDIVYSSMTLEHAEVPFTFVNNLKSKLKPGGTIYIEVPNLNDALLSVYKNKEYKRFYFRKAHIWYYTPAALLRLMEQAGFKGKIIFMQDYGLTNHLTWQTEGIPSDCNEGLSRHFAIEKMYDELLCKQGISDNVIFIGTVK